MLAGLTQAFDVEGGGRQGREGGWRQFGSQGRVSRAAGGGRRGLGGHRRVWSPRPDSLPGHDPPGGGGDSAGTRVPDTCLGRKGRR